MAHMVIEAAGIRKTFGSGNARVVALDGVDFYAVQAEFVAIMGPSGSGKSTLLSILGGLDLPDEGEIRVDGQNVLRMNETERTVLRRRHIGFVFQSFNLVPVMTATENVALPLLLDGKGRNQAHARAREALEEVGLAERAAHRPGELSGGEQQRVAIARALVTRPTVVLADEPTGNLDLESGRGVLQTLRRACDEFGQTIVLITHDAAAAAWADRVVFLRDGHVAGAMRNDEGTDRSRTEAVLERYNHLMAGGDVDAASF